MDTWLSVSAGVRGARRVYENKALSMFPIAGILVIKLSIGKCFKP